MEVIRFNLPELFDETLYSCSRKLFYDLSNVNNNSKKLYFKKNILSHFN